MILEGKIIVLTGRFSLKRKTLFEALENLGAYVVGSVSKNTDMIFVGTKPGSKLDQAKGHGIPIYNEEELLKLIRNSESTATQYWDLFVAEMEELELDQFIDVTPDDEKVYPKMSGPSAKALLPLLPESYTSFVAEKGYVKICLPRTTYLEIAFLPPKGIRQVTACMGDGVTKWKELVTLRKSKKYTWPFVFFAGNDFSDVNGYAFDSEGAVWLVEDSVPIELIYESFQTWFQNELSRILSGIAEYEEDFEQMREGEDPYEDVAYALQDF